MIAGFIPSKRCGTIIACLLAIVAATICSIFTDYPIVLACKCVIGISGGMFNVFCPKVIMETAPKEIAGFAGSTFQLMLTLGIGANAIVAYFFTSEAFESD